ncbi:MULTISPECIES: DUF3153 domain-containing protein [unclassified Nostoc]|uniref:DUF3153 domain-containing protein n=1 Tax=unclassified Nostoc TaxID=2593658 RepID=UPI0025AA3DF3|nr:MULTISPECIES: DUF3153 domain-containing protein [unclassified Nostoc]MDM9583347.1 DUF3153 domain-containing protein [Nostoc sp. GT001]MDZ7947734.1 DUF3153 domain-containing protein [Nostoc sp. EfeVER01]MDZ7993590.1 DUF3153 domain-containing protein [Nostoc sp. EspVER01]
MNSSIFGKIFLLLVRPFSFVLAKIKFLSPLNGRNRMHRVFPMRNPILWLVILTSLLLTGCVKYDVGLNFDNSNSGELVQHIKLGERLTSFSGDSVYEWLKSIERRARQLDGKAQRVSQEEIIVTIPFSNGTELQEKFNEFFNSRANQPSESVQSESGSELPKIESNVLLEQNNFLLLVRNRLIYDLDLRSLSLIASKGNVLANAGSILDLEFSLKTPWGAKNIQLTETAIEPEKNGNQLVWKLQPGELNHIEAVFWLPSPLGIGGLLIILFVSGGLYLRYNFMPDPRVQFPPKAAAIQEQ